MKHLVNRATFARRAGVSPAAITKASKRGALREAMEGDLINCGHPAAVEYLRAKGAEPIEPPPEPPTPPAHAPDLPGTQDDGSPESADALGDLSLREIARRFGGEPEFRKLLEALKLVEEIREKRLKNEREERRVIPRELVATHMAGYLDGLNRRLLSDAARTIVRTNYAAAKSGVPVEDSEAEVRKIISTQLRPAADKIARAIRNGE